MKNLILSTTVFALLASSGAAFAGTSNTENVKPVVTGDYLESRSLSVYAGACHYAGEAVTEGKEAIMAWRVKIGEYKGEKLNGLSVVAVVNGSENLAMNPTGRRALIYVDGNATPAQREALVSMVSEKYGNLLGKVTAVNEAPVRFEVKDKAYRVQVPGALYVAADKFPYHKCVMPHQVWYEPFVPLKGKEVARALHTEFKASVPSFSTFKKDEANSAYVGEFSL